MSEQYSLVKFVNLVTGNVKEVVIHSDIYYCLMASDGWHVVLGEVWVEVEL